MSFTKNTIQKFAVLFIGFFLCVFTLVPHVFAETEVEKLQAQIKSGQDRLKAIDEEISKYTKELSKVGSEKSTLQSALKKLELEHKKISADIAYTQKKIDITDLEISKLTDEITTTEGRITRSKDAIAETIRTLRASDDTSEFAALLENEQVGDFWQAVDVLWKVRSRIALLVEELNAHEEALTGKRTKQTEKRDDLVALADEYTSKGEVLANNATEKQSLLKQTQSKESEYQRILKEKKAAREAIEKETREYESKLQFILDPSTIPVAGTAVLMWPIANAIVTQYFGGTEFAKQNASVYAGRPYHPGIDIGTPRGTKIYAAYDGVVRATGNTDNAAGCWAWGKWTLVDHANGLSTLYAHQDVFSVSPGDAVKKGQVIGYSGNTGYSTGPHLHFTVYVKAAVQVKMFGATACGSVPRPTAPTSAYLDPMQYLPAR